VAAAGTTGSHAPAASDRCPEGPGYQARSRTDRCPEGTGYLAGDVAALAARTPRNQARKSVFSCSSESRCVYIMCPAG
jgi:hypothetical protein